MRCGKWLSLIGKLVLMISLCWGATLADAEPPPAGRLILCQGEVQVRRAGALRWESARLHQEIFEGDALRTGAASQAAVLCADESQVRLNEKTLLILKSVAPSPRLRPGEVTPAAPKAPPTSIYQVPQGEIWLRNKREKFQFELETPAATATIRGTEINIRVGQDGAARVILLEGSICLANAYGEVCLRPGEEGFVVPGQAPTKQVLVQPADAVQWSLYYPGIFSFRDLPLTPQPGETRAPANPPPNLAAMVQEGERAYDDGRLEEARQIAEAILAINPDNGRAFTLLGWIALQKHAPEEALGYFRRVRQVDERAIIGLALARYRLGDAGGALETMQMAYRLPPNALLVSMASYFALLAGRVDQARTALEAISRKGPPYGLPHALLAQIYLIQNKKEAAQAQAATALSESPNSPLALLTMGLVKMAVFDLPAAIQYLEKAAAADPRFVDAYVYLARIWLGSDYLSRAQKTINRALRLAPRDGTVLSLAGFVRLGYRDFEGAQKLWEEAVKVNPRLGEPHLGLAIYQFRHRRYNLGLEEMLTATLLEPRVSLYQSELGKALYQSRSFDRALEVWDYAKTLDPKDPTPHLYRGIALTDLNRPGEAIQEINKSIELNDNVAIFRGRQSLDRDLAVRNVSLARAYQQLGLTDWAFSKAVTAVKYEPFNSSAHLFLRDVMAAARSGSAAPFLTAGLLLGTANTEAALFRVLSPANQATFQSLQFRGTEALGLTRDYAPMFEMPYARIGVTGGIGAAEGSKLRQDHQGVAYGGAPGAAFEVFGRFTEDPLGRPTTTDVLSFSGSNQSYSVEANAKWEPTVGGTLTGLFEYADVKIRSDSTPFPGLVLSNGINLRSHLYELAYYHRFNPRSAFLAYFSHNKIPFHFFTRDVLGGLLFPGSFDQEFDNIQLQQHLVLPFLGEHSLIAGFDYFAANISQQFRIDVAGVGTVYSADDRPPFWSRSFYLQDYWRVRQNLVLELGLFKTFQKDAAGFPGTFYQSVWSPRFGANFQFGVGNTQHVLRAVAERHLTSHLAVQPILLPSEVAGFPWAIDSPSGSDVRQAGFAWEAHWDPKTFSTLRLNALRISTPFFANPWPGIPGDPFWQTWKRYQGSLVLNRILTTSLGLSLGVAGKRIVPDLSFQFSDNLQDFWELNTFFSLSYLHHTGWLARITPLLVTQFGKIIGHEAYNPFVIMNLTLGREFPDKRGFALFEVQNLFNRTPFYSLEPRRDPEFPSQRRFMFRLGFYF
ncbi:MAG: tetratricopeptide repeat protein [Deltaproteobacteria bacterium]|nr:tetratricopeptide repeat protein [Deltaproteobacteria bacterium]